MIRQVIFRPEAVEDVVKAAARYGERASGLAEDLIDEILIAAERAAGIPSCSESFAHKARSVAF